jgi:hypothetical protein
MRRPTLAYRSYGREGQTQLHDQREHGPHPHSGNPSVSGRSHCRWPKLSTVFKDAETADYVGLAEHCAKGDSFCSSAQAVKYGQSTPSPSAETCNRGASRDQMAVRGSKKGGGNPGAVTTPGFDACRNGAREG